MIKFDMYDERRGLHIAGWMMLLGLLFIVPAFFLFGVGLAVPALIIGEAFVVGGVLLYEITVRRKMR